MRRWQITGRHLGRVPEDWRARLASRLGSRPRRVGTWVELALFGALACMDDAGEATLDEAALLTVSSVHGPDAALRQALAEAREGPPLPIGFLNSQPGQVLPALARHLRWRGDGRCLTSRDPATALWLASPRAGAGGLLAGWVDEDAPGRSDWLRLVPAANGPALRRGHFDDLRDPSMTCVGADADGVWIAPQDD